MELHFDYKNYTGVQSRRRVSFLSVVPRFMEYDIYYPTHGPTFILDAFDLDKEEQMFFLVKEIKNLKLEKDKK